MNSTSCFRRNISFAVCIFMVIFSGFSCAPRGIQPSPNATRMPVPVPSPAPVPTPVPAEPIPPEIAEKQPMVFEEPKPRMLASLELTQQAKIFIAKNQIDRAISVLEKAIALEPANGQNYFYLAEAWLLKGNLYQALNFNELAEIHFKSDENWERRIHDQRRRIKKGHSLQ